MLQEFCVFQFRELGYRPNDSDLPSDIRGIAAKMTVITLTFYQSEI